VACVAKECPLMVIEDFGEFGEVERTVLLDLQPMIAEKYGGIEVAQSEILADFQFMVLRILAKLNQWRMSRSR